MHKKSIRIELNAEIKEIWREMSKTINNGTGHVKTEIEKCLTIKALKYAEITNTPIEKK